MYKGTKRYTFIAVFPELTKTDTQLIYISVDYRLQRDRVTVMSSVLPHSKFTVQILYKLYSLQLNFT